MPTLARALAALTVAVITLFGIDIAVRAWFPRFDRLDEQFSASYLKRELRSIGRAPIVVLGDSVLWGYHVTEDEAAFTILRRRGLPIENLSYEGGSPPNTYALLRVLLSAGIRPRLVVFNVNQKEFNAADSAYATLQPSVEQLAWPTLSGVERKMLTRTAKDGVDPVLQRWLESVWQLYGLRSDEREWLFADADAIHAVQSRLEALTGTTARKAATHLLTAERFEGTYDLSPFSSSNAGVYFSEAAAKLLERERIPAVAVLTPTNHTLLHDYIDVPEYRANLAASTKLLRAHGIRVVNLDRSFASNEFIDNDHLTVAGNARLANVLAPLVR